MKLRGLLALLNSDGEEARVVGGAVRNALLHLPVAEIDVATTALPDEVMRRVEAAGWKAVPTGIEHGTVTVVINSSPVRSDDAAPGRRDVRPQGTGGIRPRLARGRGAARLHHQRAVGIAADGKIYDYVGGLDDIAAHRVRFIGEPQQRIAEDYLRILRFFRFHAYFAEGAPDGAGLHACIVARAGLDTLSRERLRMELLKLLSRRKPRRRSRSWPKAACWAPCSAACRMSRALRTRRRSKRRSAARPIRCAGLARSASWYARTPSGCHSGCGCPTPNSSGSSRSTAGGWSRRR